MKTWAVAKFQVDGIHCWPGATLVAPYLEHKHRHVFVFKVWVEQRHDNRDVEYIWLGNTLRNAVLSWSEGHPLDFEHMSCEMIAKKLIAFIRDVPIVELDRDLKVEVFEDGENGAVVEAAAPN